MSQKNFAVTPSVSIGRSKFRRPTTHKTSFNLGEIVPIYVDADILPGDTVSMDLATLVRMSNPVAPLLDNIFIDYYAFFVPNRLVWSKWKEFMGENTSSFGAVTEPTFPQTNIANVSFLCNTGSIGDYMGLPLVSNTSPLKVSALPGRAYYLIYNEWFRDQNLITPLSVYTDSGNFLSRDTLTNTDYGYNGPLCLAAKESDYFTRALPYAQKGNPVSLPLGNYAPLVADSSFHEMTQTLGGVVYKAGFGNTANYMSNQKLGTDGNGYLSGEAGALGSPSNMNYTNLVADLSNATAATINQLRFAFQYQKFLEKDALYGTRYWEILKGHFGITAPDASLQRPEFLGHFRQHINIDQVLQTTGSDVQTPANNELGIPGANSVSGISKHIISKSFVEHGILMVLAVARHDQTYGQGVNRMWSRAHREEFYFPVFANLGSQEIKNKEIYAQGTAADDQVFGYQEAWAEYRYKPSICSGLLNPAKSGSMPWWTLTNNFGSLPTLSKSFIEQDRGNLARSLVSGLSGPDFIADFFFDAVYVRPMPMYSLPGLIDHH